MGPPRGAGGAPCLADRLDHRLYSLNMLAIAREDLVYEDVATKFFEHFLLARPMPASDVTTLVRSGLRLVSVGGRGRPGDPPGA